ncbi:MAG TPA: xylose isomerase [Thermotogota bacterium]|nr:xylose isomerase [Thermotogota bacterium]HRW92191.1 xylose isomerase [Thermotogota bacterium]
MTGPYFKNVAKIVFEGKESQNPLAFHFYNPEQPVLLPQGTEVSMGAFLRFSVAYWHTFCSDGQDMFGSGVNNRSWNRFPDPLDASLAKADAAFEFMSKLGVQYFCTHDRDLCPEQNTLRETNRMLDRVVDHIQEKMKETGIRLLWGTANLFHSPKFMHGAATSPSAKVFAYAAAQVKKMLEVTKRLGGENYVFWGGREGYETLLNNDMALETRNLRTFLEMAVEYAQQIGFTGQFLIEPKPKEPTKHQYDFDVASGIAFLKTSGLDPHFKFNVEANHATLAGHTFSHELRVARIHEMLGSVDANIGDPLLGWDTDQFPTNVYDTTLAMMEILKNGGLAPGGLNFDAHVRRPSFERKDLFYGHIAGMDAFAVGLKTALKLHADGRLDAFLQQRYASFDAGMGKKVAQAQTNLVELEGWIQDETDFEISSGRQEFLERIVNDVLLGG